MATILLEIRTDAAGAIEGIDRVNDRVQRTTSTIGDARRAAVQFVAAFAGIAGIKKLIEIADEYANITAKLKLATAASGGFARAQRDVFAIAQQTSASLSSTATLYARLAQATESLGVSQSKVADVTRAINQAFIVSGSSTAAMQGAIIQLSQAFASGTLRGDEFNSVNEAAPRIMKALAESMGVPVGALRKLAEAGELTSERLFNALSGEQAKKIAAEAAQVPLTVGRAYQQLSNSLTQFIGEADGAIGASALLAKGIRAIGESLAIIAPVLAGAGFVALSASLGRGLASIAAYVTGLSAANRETLVLARANLVLVSAQAQAARQALLLAEVQFVLTRGTAANAAATIALAEAQLAAAASSAALAGAAGAATAAGAGLGSGLLALVGGPIGAVIIGLGALYVAFQLLKTVQEEAAEKNTSALNAETDSILRQIEALKEQRRAIEGSRPDNLSKIELETKALADQVAENERLSSAALLSGNALSLQSAQWVYGQYKAAQLSKTITENSEAQTELKRQTDLLATANTQTATTFELVKRAATATAAAFNSLIAPTKSLSEELLKQNKTLSDQIVVAKGGDPFENYVKAQIFLKTVTLQNTDVLKAQLATYQAQKGILASVVAQKEAEADAVRNVTRARKDEGSEARKELEWMRSAREHRKNLIDLEIKETEAKDKARAILANIIPLIEKAYALDGLTIEQRRIAEAGIKAETFAREQLALVIKGGIPLNEAQVEALKAEAKARGEALEAAQIQTEAATEANKQAAEEYERQWQAAFDNIVDAALQGGDALKNAVKNYLRDIVAQFSKKIILDVITRYSSQGKKGKDGGGSSDDEPTIFDKGLQFVAGASGVRDAFRSGDPLSGALSGATAGAVFGPVGAIVGAIIGGLAGILGGPKPPDLRLGAFGATRKPEQAFTTAFGQQQIGVRGGTDTAQFISLVTDFDKTIAGLVGSFANGTQQLEAVQARLRTWSVDLKGDAITTEAVLGSRFNAILSTFNADIQAFVGTIGTTAERVQRLQDASFIEGAAKASILANTFNDLARILTDNKIAGESIAQTYERVSASVEILRAALAISGVQINKTGDEFIKFAADITTAAGGTQAAAQLWSAYFETFYDAEERAQSALDQANKARTAALAAVGLDAQISTAAFRAAFEAALPTLTPEQVVQWLRAGAAIGAATDAQTAYNTAVEEGAATTQAAADKIAAALLGLVGITEQIDAGFTALTRAGFSEFQNSLLTIDDTLRANIRTLTEQRAAAAAAGASSEQLAGYDLQLGRAHLLAAAQAAAAIAQLTKAGRSLVAQLRLGGGGAATLAAQGVNAFQQIGEAANNVYESMLAAQKSLREYLDSQLLGNLTALTPAEQYDEAQRQLAAAVAAGMAGDPEAIRRAQQLADVVLRLGRDRFASGQQFTDLEAAIRAALSGLLGVSPGSAGGSSTGGTAGAIGNLGDELGTQTDENRAQLMAQLTEIIRELVGATGLSLAEIASSLSLDLTAFVTSLGVNLEALTATSAASLADIARNLGVELGELAQNVGVDLGELADAQSLLNDALEQTIKGLPAGQRDALTPLLDAVEAAADDPQGLAIARAALVDAIEDGGPELANLLAPYFDEIDPRDPLYGIDTTLRSGFADVVAAINARGTVPPGTTPSALSAGNYSATSGGTPEFRALGVIAGKLASIENTIKRGDVANAAATYTTGNKQAAAIDRNARANNAGRLVMSE